MSERLGNMSKVIKQQSKDLNLGCVVPESLLWGTARKCCFTGRFRAFVYSQSPPLRCGLCDAGSWSDRQMQSAGRWFSFGFLFQLFVWVDSLGHRGRWLMIKILAKWAAFLTVLPVPFLLSPDPCVHLENYTLFQWFCVRCFYSSSSSGNGHIAHYLDTIFWEEKLVLELGCDFFFPFSFWKPKVLPGAGSDELTGSI